MAQRALRRVATAPVAGRWILTPPPEAHTPNHRRADKTLALHRREMEQMISELRNRHLSAPNISTTAENLSSTESEETLTPNSSDDRGESQAPPSKAPAVAAWHLVGRLLDRLPFLTANEDGPEIDDSERYGRVKDKKLEDHVRGIPRLAALLNSNDSFCIFRKFGDQAARLLLIKEIELYQLATKLDELNEMDAKDKKLEYRLMTIEHHETWDPAQQKLLEDIEAKLVSYYDLLLKFTDVRALAEVPARYHRSVYNWVYDNGPLDKGEDTFLLNRDDFVTARRSLEGKNQGSLIEDEVEKYLTKYPKSFLNGWLRGQAEKEKAEDPNVVHLSSLRFGILSRISAASLAVGLILAPVLILFLANLGRLEMAVVVGAFVLVFLFGVFLVVNITTHDIFIIVLAYSAVLVTLLSNFLQANASPANPH